MCVAKIEYVQGDLCNYSTLVEAFAGADVVFHIAAMVGPYHARDTYMKVNYDGTLNVIKACKEQGKCKRAYTHAHARTCIFTHTHARAHAIPYGTTATQPINCTHHCMYSVVHNAEELLFVRVC